MPKKLDYSFVSAFIEKNSGGKCHLLSKTYINIDTPLELQCQCGKTFYRKFSKIKKGSFLCRTCSINERSKKQRLNLEKVKEIISQHGCEYISGDYVNVTSKLNIKCGCGEIFQKDLLHYLRGQNHCPNCGKQNLRKKKTIYTYEMVKEILGTRGYKIDQNYYKNCYTPIKCVCPNGHKTTIKLSHFLVNHSGCKQCANDNLKGASHWNYKGGESEVIDYLRKQIKGWKRNIAIKYNGQCFLTKSKKDCVVHHLVGFNVIIKETCEELGLPMKRKLSDYTKNDLKRLVDGVLSRHTTNVGVLLQRKVHNKFHSLYGKGNNTIDQFVEFVKKHYPNIPTSVVEKI